MFFEKLSFNKNNQEKKSWPFSVQSYPRSLIMFLFRFCWVSLVVLGEFFSRKPVTNQMFVLGLYAVQQGIFFTIARLLTIYFLQQNCFHIAVVSHLEKRENHNLITMCSIMVIFKPFLTKVTPLSTLPVSFQSQAKELEICEFVQGVHFQFSVSSKNNSNKFSKNLWRFAIEKPLLVSPLLDKMAARTL